MRNTNKDNQNGKFSLHREVELPIDGLPQRVQLYIKEVVRVFQCPIEFPIVAVLAAFATAIGKRVRVTDGKYSNQLMLWFVNIAISGSNKTMPIKQVLKPLSEINSENYDRFNAEYAAWKADKERDESHPPVFDQVLIGDCTDEARNQIFLSSRTGGLGHYPEIKGYFEDMERYTKGGSEDKLLRLYDNDEIYINRKGDERPIVIKDAFMCIVGDIQPGLLVEAFGKPRYMQNGLDTRFNFTMPKIVEFPDREKESMDQSLVDAWRDIIRRAYHENYSQNQTILFSPECDELYNFYFNSLQRKKEQIASTTGDSYLMSLYSKLQIQAMRLAGIVHMMNAICCKIGYDDGLIPANVMEYTIRCMAYFEQSAMAVYDLLRGAAPGGVKPMTQADLIRSLNEVKGIKNQAAFAEGLGVSPAYISTVLKAGSK
jgi:hypothetical protein